MTSKAFRTLALSLPEAHEESHFERTLFRLGAVGVRLARVDAELMRELVTDAWRRAAPKRAQARLAPIR